MNKDPQDDALDPESDQEPEGEETPELSNLEDPLADTDTAVKILGGWKRGGGNYQIGTTSISVSESGMPSFFKDSLQEAAGTKAPENPLDLLLSDPNCSEEILIEALSGDDVGLIRKALRHPNAPEDEIMKLLRGAMARGWTKETRTVIYQTVLANIDISPEIIEACWEILKDPGYLWLAATHPNTPEDLFQKLLILAHPEDLNLLALNREALEALDDNLLSEVDAARIFFNLRINFLIRVKMGQHPSFTLAGVKELIEESRENDRTASSPRQSAHVRNIIARWPGAPPGITHELELDYDESVRLALLDNPNTSQDLILMWKLYSRPGSFHLRKRFLDGWLESLSPDERTEVDNIANELGELEPIVPIDRLADDPPEIAGLDDLL